MLMISISTFFMYESLSISQYDSKASIIEEIKHVLQACSNSAAKIWVTPFEIYARIVDMQNTIINYLHEQQHYV